jgi:hypothetical protein
MRREIDVLIRKVRALPDARQGRGVNGVTAFL